MKRKRLLAVSIVFLLVTLSVAQIDPPGKSLPATVSAGKARATLRGTGASTGDALKLTVAKNPKAGPGPLRLTLPPGLRVSSSSGAAQDMVIAGLRGIIRNRRQYVPVSEIVLDSLAPKEYLLEAYCANFRKDNPTASTTFKFQGVDARLACIIRASHASRLSIVATQAAVWMQTDHVTFAQMKHKFPVTQTEWDAGRKAFQRCHGVSEESRPPTRRQSGRAGH